jgi:hypothetical protein
MDNGQGVAPMIPAGTEPTVWGTKSFVGAPNQGQATTPAQTGQSESVPTEGVQSNPVNASQGTTFAELAAKKGFKSVEDLAAAYQNLESQNKKVEMSLAELVKLRDESFAAEPVITQPVNQVQSQDEAIKIVEGIARRTIRPLEDKLALQDLLLRQPDAQQFAVEMAAVIKQDPNVTWETAYKAAKFDVLNRQADALKQQQAQQVQELKQRASIGSTKSAANAPVKSLDDLVNDRTIPFAEVQRIMKERFTA